MVFPGFVVYHGKEIHLTCSNLLDSFYDSCAICDPFCIREIIPEDMKSFKGVFNVTRNESHVLILNKLDHDKSKISTFCVVINHVNSKIVQKNIVRV